MSYILGCFFIRTLLMVPKGPLQVLSLSYLGPRQSIGRRSMRPTGVITLMLFVLVLCSCLALPESLTIAQPSETPVARVYLPLVSRQSRLIYSSLNLAGHSLFPECNPGNASSCPCSDADVSLLTFDNYGEVTSNVRTVNTYVNAIGYKKFVESLPSGEAISLGVYTYRGEVNLPTLPNPDAAQTNNPQAVHLMIQLWDGRNALFPSHRETVEGTIYWDLNPWVASEYGKVKVYTKSLNLVDTGIKVIPTAMTNWHSFEVVVDLKSQKYISITIDGDTRDLSALELARVSQPSWGNEVSLSITTESLATWPQADCSNVFSWATRFRNLEFRKYP